MWHQMSGKVFSSTGICRGALAAGTVITKESNLFLWLQVFSLVLLQIVEEGEQEEEEGEEPKAQAVTCPSTSPIHPTSWSRHPRSVARASQWKHIDISGCRGVGWMSCGSAECETFWNSGVWILLDSSPALLPSESVLQQEGCIQLLVREHPVQLAVPCFRRWNVAVATL